LQRCTTNHIDKFLFFYYDADNSHTKITTILFGRIRIKSSIKIKYDVVAKILLTYRKVLTMNVLNSRNIIYYLSLFILVYSTNIKASELTLAVANSTCSVIKKLGNLYTTKHNIKFKYICKSSGRLAKGIKGQAISADLYLSANKTWMDFVVKGGIVSQDSVVNPWGNSLVVAVPKSSPLKLNQWQDLTEKKIKTIMIGDPGTAPFGRYAKQAMQNGDIWSKVKVFNIIFR